MSPSRSSFHTSLLAIACLHEVVFEIQLYRRARERFGVSLSGKGRWPQVVNVSNDGLARGRLRPGDCIIAVNRIQVFDEEEANRLLRESSGKILLTVYRKNGLLHERDDLTEIAVTFSSSDIGEPLDDDDNEETGSVNELRL